MTMDSSEARRALQKGGPLTLLAEAIGVLLSDPNATDDDLALGLRHRGFVAEQASLALQRRQTTQKRFVNVGTDTGEWVGADPPPEAVQDAIHGRAPSPMTEVTAAKELINITVYGTPVLDVIIRVGPYAPDAAGVRAIESIGRLSQDGTIDFEPDSYIRAFVQGESVVFGPFNPAGEMDRYLPGQKYPISLTVGSDSIPERCATLLGPHVRLGGGGANVLAGFFNVFAKLKVQFIAATEETSRPGRLDPFIESLTNVVGEFSPVRLYEQPGINLCIEGLGPHNERTIFAGQLNETMLRDELPRPRGRSIMVNTVYSPLLALDAFANATYGDRIGVLALTKSLCSKKELPDGAWELVRSRHGTLCDSVTNIRSVFEFVKDVVLPQGNCICIFNEDELEHLSGVDLFTSRNRTRVPTLGGIIQALRVIRQMQGRSPSRVYVTCGRWGSFVLNEHDHVIYCSVYTDPTRLPQGKTAIGDTYATFVLALETIGSFGSPNRIPAEHVILAAAAGADAGVYLGFGLVGVADVNGYIGQSGRILVDLGLVGAFPVDTWRLGLDDVRESDYVSLRRRSLSTTPGTLQEVIGAGFLRAPAMD